MENAALKRKRELTRLRVERYRESRRCRSNRPQPQFDPQVSSASVNSQTSFKNNNHISDTESDDNPNVEATETGK